MMLWRVPILAFLAAINLIACTPASIKHQFDVGRIPIEKWDQEEKECRYEAEKAAAAAPVNIAEYRKNRLYILCLENKGAIYEGEKRVLVE
jgi:hypothetical protein